MDLSQRKNLTNDAFEAIAQRFRALGDPTRLKIIYNLGGEELTVGGLVERTGGSQSNISKHLSLLLTHGFVQRRREGTSAYYSVTDSSIFSMCDLVCGGIDRNLENWRRAFE